MRGVELSRAVWPQVEARRRRVLLVPLGALEQHGPHLPLDTDTRIAAAVAAGAADVAGRADVGVAPAVPVGASGEHAGFPGTLSIGTEALAMVVIELVRDAARDWASVLLVNAHGGNADAIGSSLAQLHAEGRRCAVFHAAPRGGDAHAGRTETSLMLHLAPELVRWEAAAAGNSQPIASLLPTLRRSGVRAVSPNGVLGDPAGATAEEGARLLEDLARACAACVEELAEGGT